MIINDISRSKLVRYFCGKSDTSNKRDTSDISNTANSGDTSKTSARICDPIFDLLW